MPSLTASFLLLSLILAVVVGGVVEPWLWGPALVALTLASISALPSIWRQKMLPSNTSLIAFGAVTAAWFGWRAFTSPVTELAQADLMLLTATVCSFICIQSITGHRVAEKILTYGIALLVLASLIIVGIQWVDPTYRVLYIERADRKVIGGFFPHYNDGANFLVASSLMVLAAACFGHERKSIRSLLAIIAIAGLAAVLLTHSRGGILSATVGCGAFAAALLLYGRRQKAKWFPFAAIFFPIVGITLITILIFGWKEAQGFRGESDNINQLMDNTSRLQLLGIAFECIKLHPWLGGGSQSFSWEFFKGWDISKYGYIDGNPNNAHNEWVQATTDYGLISAALLIGFMTTLIIAAILRMVFENSDTQDKYLHDSRVGGFASLIGVLVHACFSFVFHLVPGAMMLGIALGKTTRTENSASGPSKRIQQSILTVALVASIAVMLPLGWKTTQVALAIGHSELGKNSASIPLETKIHNLDRAIQAWPQASIYRKRARAYQELIAKGKPEDFTRTTGLAVADYQAASQLNPYDPNTAINLANLLSLLGHNEEAEKYYQQVISAQGGFESTFHGHYLYAIHLHRKGIRQLSQSNTDAAIQSLRYATEHIDETEKMINPHYMGSEGRALQIAAHETLGIAYEIAGHTEEALASYEKAATANYGDGRHIMLRCAMLQAKQANEIWHKRQPGKALTLFLKARDRFNQAGDKLPEGVTKEQRDAFKQQLDQTIQLLQDAKIEQE